jgi:hypothetical protein
MHDIISSVNKYTTSKQTLNYLIRQTSPNFIIYRALKNVEGNKCQYINIILIPPRATRTNTNTPPTHNTHTTPQDYTQ